MDKVTKNRIQDTLFVLFITGLFIIAIGIIICVSLNYYLLGYYLMIAVFMWCIVGAISNFKYNITNATFFVVTLAMYYSVVKTMIFNQQIAFYMVIEFGFWFMLWAIYLVFTNSSRYHIR
jgi:hypothetical protein